MEECGHLEDSTVCSTHFDGSLDFTDFKRSLFYSTSHLKTKDLLPKFIGSPTSNL